MRMAGQAQRPVQATHTHAGTLRHANGRCPRAHARAATRPPLPSSPASRHNTASGRVVVAGTESRPPHTWASSPLLSHQGSTAPSGRGPRLPGSRGRPQAARHAPQARPLSARAGVGHRLGACPLRVTCHKARGLRSWQAAEGADGGRGGEQEQQQKNLVCTVRAFESLLLQYTLTKIESHFISIQQQQKKTSFLDC